ncbi:MAG: hypothetical protein K0S32_4333, partial [Bacteroidetes bacterium]|nr:hypothetical protein [Bacteroidota bacterium]
MKILKFILVSFLFLFAAQSSAQKDASKKEEVL